MVKTVLKILNPNLFFAVVCLFYATRCLGSPFVPDTNYIDSNNLKQGFWRICREKLCYDAYYVNDTLNGVFKTYYQNKMISSFGLYNKGKMIGVWYYFDETGRLLMEVSQIESKGYVLKKDIDSTAYTTKSFIKIFYLNGVCKEEGFAIYDDVEIDFERIGKWEYYDEKGRTQKIEKEN